MPDQLTLATIVLMAASSSASTCLTRIPRSPALRERTLRPRTLAMMENVAGYAVIAPAFALGTPAKLLALAATPLAAMRLPLLPTVIIGVAATGCPPHIFG